MASENKHLPREGFPPVRRASSLRGWPRHLIGGVITLAIFVWILKPVFKQWDKVQDQIWHADWRRTIAASILFAAFLFLFRVLSWRRILIGFGHRLPVAATARVWSVSELARYLPGVIWQLVGRAYLVRPYGVPAEVCSTSQILELAIFLLANMFLAIGCLAWFGYKQMPREARGWLILVSLLAPLLLLSLRPRFFYGLTNRVLTSAGRPPIDAKLGYGRLLSLLLFALIGLLWQSLAIYLVTAQYLNLQLAKWWVVAGAYCLAWCAGFLAFWAPGGLGIRELVFVGAMQVALPLRVRQHFADPHVRLAFLAFLSVLLRLWATMGELILTTLSSAIDYRGWLGESTLSLRRSGEACGGG